MLADHHVSSLCLLVLTTPGRVNGTPCLGQRFCCGCCPMPAVLCLLCLLCRPCLHVYCCAVLQKSYWLPCCCSHDLHCTCSFKHAARDLGCFYMFLCTSAPLWIIILHASGLLKRREHHHHTGPPCLVVHFAPFFFKWATETGASSSSRTCMLGSVHVSLSLFRWAAVLCHLQGTPLHYTQS